MIEAKLDRALEAACQTLGWTLHRQVRVGRYVLDFLVETPSAWLIVEADGAAWHERTEDQGLKDRIRDRFFLWTFGVPTVRFLGSEILRNVDACMSGVVQCASSLGKGQRAILKTGHAVQRHAPTESALIFVEAMAQPDEPDLDVWKFDPEKDIAQ